MSEGGVYGDAGVESRGKYGSGACAIILPWAGRSQAANAVHQGATPDRRTVGEAEDNNTKFDLRWGLRITKELLDNLLFSKPPRCVVTPTQPPPGGGSFRIHTLSGSHGIQHATVRVLNIFVEKASRPQS